MSISNEIIRLQNAKSALATSIGNKGVTVPASTKLDGYPALVDQIQTGGGGSDDEWVRPSNWPDYTKIPMSSIGTDELYMTFDCRPAIRGEEPAGFCVRVIAPSGYTVERGYIGDSGFVSVATTQMASNTYYTDMLPTDEGDFAVYRVTSTGSITLFTFSQYGNYIGNRALTYSSLLELYGKLENATQFECQRQSQLTSATVSLKSIDRLQNMFNNCYSLVNVDESLIDTSNATTLQQAFSGCRSLRKLNVSSWDTSKVTNMINTFSTCVLLQEITGINNWDTSKVTSMQNAFYSCDILSKVDISRWKYNALTTNQAMFSNSPLLRKVEMDASLTLLSQNVFNTCQLCTTYIFHSTTPPSMANVNAFSYINSDAKIYVPDESVNAYKTASNWSTYASYIYPLSDYTE